MSKPLQDALDYAGSSITTLTCIVSGLASQLKASQGTAAIQDAQDYALKVAKVYPSAPGVAPDVKAISEFFNGHK